MIDTAILDKLLGTDEAIKQYRASAWFRRIVDTVVRADDPWAVMSVALVLLIRDHNRLTESLVEAVMLDGRVPLVKEEKTNG